MLKKIKILEEKVKNFIQKIKQLEFKITKALNITKKVFIGSFTYLIILGILLISTKETKQSSVFNVFSDNEITDIKETEDSNIVKEKIAIDPKTIFTNEEKTEYALMDLSLKIGPDNNYETYCFIEKGTELKTLGVNEYGFTKILYNETEVYAPTEALVENKNYVFDVTEIEAFILEDTNLYQELDELIVIKKITTGEKVVITGTNESGFTRITFDNNIFYVNTDCITTSPEYVFEKCDEIKYAKDGAIIYSKMNTDSELIKQCNAAEEITIIGKNDSNYYKVLVNGTKGYIEKSKVSDEKNDLYPYLTLSAKSSVKYYEDNMLPGIIATVPESEKNEENLNLLAKLVWCECGINGYEGMRAVATVVVNRAYDGTMGNTIRSVIYRPHQFSPVSNGSLASCNPPQEAYDAAYDVLYNGYRSFPAYVLYFQSIKDGYFKGHYTYLVTQKENGTWKSYFSYKKSDYEKYKK